TDVIGDPLSPSTSFTFNGGPVQPGLPANLTLTDNGFTSADGFDTHSWALGGIAYVAPGTYVVTVSLTDGGGATPPTTLTINVLREDARAYYAGLLFASTSAVTSSPAPVPLSATIKDITAVLGDPATDAYAGDIRNARVTFINRDTTTVIASNVPV